MPPRHRMKRIASLVFIAGLVFQARVVATTVRVVNLLEMVSSADRIFEGRCMSVEEELHENGLPVLRYEFEVIRGIKGTTSGEILTFRQLRGPGPKGLGFAGLPVYKEGQEVVLFLAGESRIGLTSPVGFGQGVFSLEKSRAGQARLINELQNQNLLYQVSDTDLSRVGLQASRVAELSASTLTLETLGEAVRLIEAYEKSHASGPTR